MERLQEDIILKNGNVSVKLNRNGDTVEIIRYNDSQDIIMRWVSGMINSSTDTLTFYRKNKNDCVEENTYYDVQKSQFNALGDPTKNEYDQYGRLIYSEVYTAGKFSKWIYLNEKPIVYPLIKLTTFETSELYDTTMEYYNSNGYMAYVDEELESLVWD